MKISNEVCDVLAKCTTDGPHLYLPAQLDRKLYTNVNKVIEGLGGKWNRSSKSHVFSDRIDVAESIANAAETGEWVDLKKEFQFFPTPAALVKKMVEAAGLRAGMSVFEPSVGEGAILFGLPSLNLLVFCIELNQTAIDKIKGRDAGSNTWDVRQGDFLTFPRGYYGPFDAIIMNPPFSKNQDIKHTMHAWQFLKPGGVLVSILSATAPSGSRKIHDEFRAFVRESGGEIEELPEGAFKEAGTGVRTVMLRMRKPA